MLYFFKNNATFIGKKKLIIPKAPMNSGFRVKIWNIGLNL